MLAAVPAEDTRILEMFRLALSLASRGERAPHSLESYFEKILSQARSLSEDPESLDEPLMPEAIQLAVELGTWDSFRKAIEGVSDLSSIKPDQATTILDSMEHHIVSES